MSFLAIENLTKDYGKIRVLAEVNFAVAELETFAIIGPNGAGKTTLFKCVTGEILPDKGVVRYQDLDVTRLSAHQRVRRGFGRTFQVARVFPNYTVTENIIVAIEARLRHKRPRGWLAFRPRPTVVQEACEAAARVNLDSKADLHARFLSHGDKKRLEIAMMLALGPRVLLMDEPTAGMSPSDRQQTVQLIDRVRRELRVTVMLTEHDMDVVFGLADRVLVLNHGRVIAVGSTDEVRASPAVREVYLGEELSDA